MKLTKALQLYDRSIDEPLKSPRDDYGFATGPALREPVRLEYESGQVNMILRLDDGTEIKFNTLALQHIGFGQTNSQRLVMWLREQQRHFREPVPPVPQLPTEPASVGWWCTVDPHNRIVAAYSIPSSPVGSAARGAHEREGDRQAYQRAFANCQGNYGWIAFYVVRSIDRPPQIGQLIQRGV